MPDSPGTDLAETIRAEAERLAPRLIELRRDIHAHPELSFEEVRTAELVARELERMGIERRTGVGRTGVLGTIAGGRPGPAIAIRADMDALPIQEKTGLAYASRSEGKMHACGHDIHTATLLGVGGVLKALAPRLAGTVKLVFQPAEEIAGGAKAMIEEGVLDSPRVEMALGFHNMPEIPVGRFGYVRGSSLAAVDFFEVEVRGQSGHAAYPHQAVDPIVAAATLVTQMQTVVAREVSPFQPAVVTVGAIQGGMAHNIIPDSVLLKGTVRTLEPAVRDQVEAALGRLCEGVSTAMRVKAELHYHRFVPPVVSDDALLDRAIASIRRQLGEVVAETQPVMGGEDFALFSNAVPSAHLRIGSGAPGRADMLHNSDYQPAEACIALGVQAIARIAADILA